MQCYVDNMKNRIKKGLIEQLVDSDPDRTVDFYKFKTYWSKLEYKKVTQFKAEKALDPFNYFPPVRIENESKDGDSPRNYLKKLKMKMA